MSCEKVKKDEIAKMIKQKATWTRATVNALCSSKPKLQVHKLESLPLPKPSIEDLKVINDHLKKAANKMENPPGSAVATSKW